MARFNPKEIPPISLFLIFPLVFSVAEVDSPHGSKIQVTCRYQIVSKSPLDIQYLPPDPVLNVTARGEILFEPCTKFKLELFSNPLYTMYIIQQVLMYIFSLKSSFFEITLTSLIPLCSGFEDTEVNSTNNIWFQSWYLSGEMFF